MNGYGDLLTRLRNVMAKQTHHTIVDEAAAAIKTLVAERDALIDEVRDRCFVCVHFDKDLDEFPCCKCMSPSNDNMSYWKWRGAQKEGK